MEQQEGCAFKAIIPNLNNRLRQCDESITDEGFQEIDRMLTEAQNGSSDETSVKTSPHFKALNLRGENKELTEPLMEREPKKGFHSFAGGKENIIPQRNRFSRRERSSRTISHRKAFAVDLRTFGSIVNGGNELQDVQAFWEAADEREASEAIMGKLRAGTVALESKDGNATSTSRRRRSRRNISIKRRTARSKAFSAKILSVADLILSLDHEQLEEESETEFSSFTFSTDPLLELDNIQWHKNQTVKDKSNASRFLGVHGEELLEEVTDTKHAVEGEKDESTRDHDHEGSLLIASRKGDMQNIESEENPVKMTEIVRSILSEAAADVMQPPNVTDNAILVQSNPADFYNDVTIEVTPYYRNTNSRRATFTSPTPPSNPLEGFSLRNGAFAASFAETAGKRRLEAEFDDVMDPAVETSKLADTCMEIDCTVSSQKCPDCDHGIALAQVQNLDMGEQAGPSKSTEIVLNENQDSSKSMNKKRDAMVTNRRHSLEDAGTNWSDGVRRSTRIRSRPLEWWRGERFLLGRVHKSLATVIGIKYSSPPHCWPKENAKPPKFKVVSYVPDKYAKYVQFAALH